MASRFTAGEFLTRRRLHEVARRVSRASSLRGSVEPKITWGLLSCRGAMCFDFLLKRVLGLGPVQASTRSEAPRGRLPHCSLSSIHWKREQGNTTGSRGWVCVGVSVSVSNCSAARSLVYFGGKTKILYKNLKRI
jgi:hypothetical protein